MIMAKKFLMKTGWVSTDAWRGYSQPVYAVAGSSDTGTWSDSSCPTPDVTKEINDARNFLKSRGISTRETGARSSNVFMGKRWIIVTPEDYKKAKMLMAEYLKEHDSDTQYIHDADVIKKKLKSVV
jgi:hypothetical protein